MNKINLFKKILITASCIAITIIANLLNVNAQFYKYLGPVNTTTGIPTSNAEAYYYNSVGLTGYYGYERHLMKYTPLELGSSPMMITAFSLYYVSKENTSSNTISSSAVLIKLSDPDDVNGSTFPPSMMSGSQVYYAASGAAQWEAEGYTLVWGPGTFTCPNPSTPQWINFELPDPIMYNGNQSFHIVLLTNNGSYSSQAWVVWNSYIESPNPAINRGSMSRNDGDPAYHYSNESFYGDATKRGLKYNVRLTYIPPGISNLSCEPVGNNDFPKELINSSHSMYNLAIPRFSFDMKEIQDVSLQHKVIYEIQGPLPSTNVVYRMVDPNTPANEFITVTKNDGVGANYIYSSDVLRATGPMVWTGVGADNKSFDLRNVAAGQYRCVLKVKTLSSLPQFVDTLYANSFFNVRVANDVVAYDIVSPARLGDYPISGNVSIRLNVSVQNVGFNPLDSFKVQCRIYKCSYDQFTDVVIRDQSPGSITYLPNFNDGDPTDDYFVWRPVAGTGASLLTGENVILDERSFGEWIPPSYGWYDIEFEVQMANPLIDDQELSNNIYPRSGMSGYPLRAQWEVDPYLTDIKEPVTDVTSLGRTVYVTTGLVNDGLVDISETDWIYLWTRIYRRSDYNGNCPSSPMANTGLAVFSNRYQVKRGGTSEGEVNIYCVDAEGDLLGWEANETGNFVIETTIDWGGPSYTWEPRARCVTMDFTVLKGLSGTYRVGNGQRFNNINEALDSLHFRGVDGPVTFELTDEEYTERRWSPQMRDAPALDFRSKIPGVYGMRPVVGGAPGEERLVTNTVRFVPSYQRSNQRGSIRINLESLNGVGMWFGASDDSVTSRYEEPMINLVPNKDKKKWSESDGYIIWDGGINKSIRLTYKRPDAEKLTADLLPYFRGEEFRAPVYITNGRNITIKNCIIEDGVNQERSRAYSLPGNTYAGPNLQWTKDYENYAGNTNISYSAGIIMRTKPPYQERYQENRFSLDTLTSYNNVFSGNEITKFSYGIVGIGLNYRLSSTPHLIDVKDTLYGLTQFDLDKNGDMSYTGIHKDTVVVGSVKQVHTVRVYIQLSSVNRRSNTFYKYTVVRDSNDAVQLNSYTIIVDSSQGGVRRVFNKNNLIEGNLIYDIGRAGIFMGNDENSIIRNNRIHGITGEIEDENHNRVDSLADCAGILLGGRQRADDIAIDGFVVLGTKVYRNEISNVASEKSVSGIKLEQTMLVESISATDILFPDAFERIEIYSNIIWGILPKDRDVDRYGINLSIAKRRYLAGDTSWRWDDTLYYSTARNDYYMNHILLANNTILMEEDDFNSRGDYYGIKLQKLLNSRVLNNAIEMSDSTFDYSRDNGRYAASIYYQSAEATSANNEIDYNVYSYNKNEDVPIDAYRCIITDISWVVVDEGYRGEYKTLSNWQNWMKTDIYSTTKSFVDDFEKTEELFPKFRFRRDPVPVNCPLEKRGTYLIETEVDIDSVDRVKGDQRLDIGAQFLSGIRYTSDVEILNIMEPATYFASLGPLSDAEYFMIKDEPIKVKVLLRNNGNGTLLNHPITLRIYEEPESVNNANARIHNRNFDTTYYTNERGHSRDTSTFMEIPITGEIFWEGTKNVTIASGEGLVVEFDLSDKKAKFNTYWDLWTLFQKKNYTVPIQFSTMRPNVTPRYLFVANADISGDMDPNNNEFRKYARFYIKKSQKDMLVTAFNTYNKINKDTIINNIVSQVPDKRVTNIDNVAGKLNLDTIIAGFRRINYVQHTENEEAIFDFDVLDRKAWDYRNVDYTLYNTLFYTDDLEGSEYKWEVNKYDVSKRYFQDKWLIRNLTDFLNKGTSTHKTNLIIVSEEFIKGLYLDFNLLTLNRAAKSDLVDKYLKVNVVLDSITANGPIEYYPVSPLYKEEPTESGVPPVTTFTLQPLKYAFNGKMGSITGVNLAGGTIFNIKETGWQWTDADDATTRVVKDADPYGLLIKPIDNMLGYNVIGAVFDTLKLPGTLPPGAAIPNQYKIASLTRSTLHNTIALVTFDWRHFAKIDALMLALLDFMDKNSIGGDDGTLPIALYDFDATAISNRVELSWNTVKQAEVAKFIVERAENATDFSAIESIDAEKNTIAAYNLTDKNLKYATDYTYRLQVIGVDGRVKYSDTRNVRTEEAVFGISEIIPNPVSSISKFTLTTGTDQEVSIFVYDLAGKEVLVINNGKLLSGSCEFSINASALPAGSYTLVVKNGNNETMTKTFNIVK